MPSRILYRWSGGTLLVGGLLSLVSSILSAFLYPGNNTTPEQILSTPWLLGEVILFIGILLISMGFPGCYLRQAGRAGGLGFAGFVLLWLGLLLGGVSFSVVRLTIFPYLAQSAPKLLAEGSMPVAAFLLLIIGPVLLLTVGGILLGIATMRARVFPRWAGILLLLSGIISIITFVLPPSTVGDIIEPVGDGALFLALAWFGYALVAQEKEPVAEQSLATSAAQPGR
jgi:hypothetical protein